MHRFHLFDANPLYYQFSPGGSLGLCHEIESLLSNSNSNMEIDYMEYRIHRHLKQPSDYIKHATGYVSIQTSCEVNETSSKAIWCFRAQHIVT
jgi:hypothetical protein